MAAKPLQIDRKDLAQLAESPVGFRRVAGLFRPHVWQLVLVTLIIVCSSVTALGQPLLIRYVIDEALPEGNTGMLIWSVVGMVAVSAVTGVLAVWQTWIATKVGQQLMHQMRVRVFGHLQSQSLEFFKKTRAGEIQSRLSSDIAGMQSVITSTATSVATNLTTTIATLVAMFVLNWRFALLSLVILPPAAMLTRRVAIVRRAVTAERQRTMADLLSQVEESLSVSGAQLVKTLGAGRSRMSDFDAMSSSLASLELRSRMAGKWRMAWMNLVFAAVPAVIYLAAGFPQTSGGLTIGTLIAFTTLQVSVFRPMMGLLNIGAEWVSSMALLSRIFGYLDLPVDVPEPGEAVTVRRDSIRGEVTLENVSYRYPDSEVDALSGINLRIRPGESIAVVGETGSGKSTLGTLLARLADPTAGRITIDGIDLRDFSAEDLRGIVGVVSQEVYLLHASIRRNLLEAKPDATEKELWAALKAAQVDTVVRSLPDGMDTIVGARGHRFSGGERQRVAIARTLLRNPKVLILDEATSALDAETERELQDALDHLIRGRTTLTIAHRLSTVRDTNRIYVLEQGSIIERGTHEELVEVGGHYARMANGDDLERGEGPLPRRAIPSAARHRSDYLWTAGRRQLEMDPAG